MRKILLIAVFLLPFLAKSQVIVSDDFDSYNVGDLIAASSPDWTTWSGGVAGEDAPVSDAQSFSSPNSIYILDDASDADLLLPAPSTLTSGIYEYKMKIYVVSGKTAYFNMQESTTPGIGWMFEAFFNANGTGSLDAGGVGAATFTYTQNSWTDVRVVADLNSDVGEFYVDGSLIHTWQWSTGNDGLGTANTLGGVNIYANTNNEYYVDDVVFTDITNPPVVCPVTSVPTVTSGSNCGTGSVTLSATTGGANTYVVWMDSSGNVVGSGNTFTTPEISTTTSFFAADADTTGQPVHVGPDTSIASGPFPASNFTNGLFFTALTDLRIDSIHVYSNGALSGNIQISDTAGGAIIASAPFSLPGAGYHQIYLGLNVKAGDYFMNMGNLSGTGVLFRTTAGATYPYTVPGVVSITGANFADPARYYYFFDWTVTPVCFGTQVPVVASILPANNTLPFFEDFENGLPCNWTTMQDPSSFGWLWGDSTSLSSTNWMMPAHTNFMASNDDSCNCDMSLDYLISPVFDFSQYSALTSITLNFEAYYDSAWGSSAYVEVSLDSGVTWNVIHTLSPSTSWQSVIVDLSPYSGNSAVQIAFHHDDNGVWADGFAVDDVLITAVCSGEELTVNLVTDIFGTEISWSIVDVNSGVIYGSGGPFEDINPYNVNAATHNATVCVPVGATLEWQIDDSYGDGLTDGNNVGFYNLFGPCGELITSGDSAFTYGGTPPLPNPGWDSLVFTIQPPVINLGADTIICEGTSILLDAGLPNVTWSTGETTQSITVSNLTPGTWPYYVSTPAGNCFATDTIAITVNPLPVPDFTATANLGTVTFTNSSANATTYHWNFGTGNPADTSNAMNPTFTYTVSDTFTVVLTATNDCGSVSFTLDVPVNIVGINEIPGALIGISPNPSSELLNVSISGISGSIRLSIVNVLGQQIYSDELKSDGNHFSKIIDVSNYDKGVYFITLQTEQHATTRKLVVE